MFDKDAYLDLFNRNRAAIVHASRLGLDARVKGCPDWDVGGLLAHTVGAYTFWITWIDGRPHLNGSAPESWQELRAKWDARIPNYTEWRSHGFSATDRPANMEQTAIETGDELEAKLRALDSSEPVWTIDPRNQTAGFIQRRIAHETTIHRWDAEQAHHVESPIPNDIARDGIDEILPILDAELAPVENRTIRAGQVFSFRESGGAQLPWRVVLHQQLVVTRDEGAADVEITGSASDILLFMQGRRRADEMTVVGSVELAEGWGRLVGQFG